VDTVAGVVRFSDIQFDNGTIFWLEGRPTEGGRSVLVRRQADGTLDEPLANEINVRTMVHEYGGGAYAARHGHVVYSDFADQRLRRFGEIEPLTASPAIDRGVRFADMELQADGSLVCVRETHPTSGGAVNEVVQIAADGRESVIATGADFYASPVVSLGGDRIAWVEWDHPNMPWDDTRLVVAPLADPSDGTIVAGGEDESVLQPTWDKDGSLVFISDRTGWWNLYRIDRGSVTAITSRDADFASPAWLFGERSYVILDDGGIVSTFWAGGRHHLATIDIDGGLTMVDDGYAAYRYLASDGANKVWFVGTRADRPTAVVEFDLDSGSAVDVVSNASVVDDPYISAPDLMTFPTTRGDEAHAVFYPPCNPLFAGPDDELPPLLVHVHGGPTSHVTPRYDPGILFWTTRGFGIVDVNYRGSTGFGRAYRQKLTGEWGILDVDDAVAAAEYLAEQGEADGNRLAISGGSAGGYTTLAALAFTDTFAAGVSYFGVADIEVLGRDTHKFESQYVTGLVGDDPEVWRERSPLYSADQITVPVALFQGLDDTVVPPNQAIMIADELARNGVPYLHIEFEGEGHGFRRSENIVRTLETELAFFGAVFGFAPAGGLRAVHLNNI
jgi:dipeptidyl aminopeptidase/acylaminoacyl peptidase